MTIDVLDEAPAAQEQVEEVDERAALKAELAALVELTNKKVDRNDLTPCAGCTILVPITVNECPHCNSNIAANNALMRESLRRLAEIRGELDGEHERHAEDRHEEPEKVAFWSRIKRSFSGSGTPADGKSDPVTRDDSGPRFLDNVAEGDHLKVLEYDDPWFKVKTRDGCVGWVYSTLVKEP